MLKWNWQVPGKTASIATPFLVVVDSESAGKSGWPLLDRHLIIWLTWWMLERRFAAVFCVMDCRLRWWPVLVLSWCCWCCGVHLIWAAARLTTAWGVTTRQTRRIRPRSREIFDDSEGYILIIYPPSNQSRGDVGKKALDGQMISPRGTNISVKTQRWRKQAVLSVYPYRYPYSCATVTHCHPRMPINSSQRDRKWHAAR